MNVIDKRNALMRENPRLDVHNATKMAASILADRDNRLLSAAVRKLHALRQNVEPFEVNPSAPAIEVRPNDTIISLRGRLLKCAHERGESLSLAEGTRIAAACMRAARAHR
jgi:hypothetical protein